MAAEEGERLQSEMAFVNLLPYVVLSRSVSKSDISFASRKGHAYLWV